MNRGPSQTYIYIQFIINKHSKCRRQMTEVRQIPLETVIKNLADSVAIQFHVLSKKCVTLMKRKVENQQNLRMMRRQALLAKYKARILERKKQQNLIPNTQNQPQQTNEVQQRQPEESRLTRINRIKQAMFNKNVDLKPSEQSQNENQEANFGINLQIVFYHFSQELRPQILAKYPSAQPEKVNKVILQKWTTFDPAKKEAYIKKIKKKIDLLQKKKNQDEAIKPQTASQINTEINHQEEVKREEAIEQYQSKPLNQQNGTKKNKENERIYTKQESKVSQREVMMQRESYIDNIAEAESGVKQKYEPNSGFQ